ncbi:MAG: type II toxin-antitoxin system RelE/ParE family toxin [Herminiimonas sp.]|nr:type II toxin-antitoxin system RelE/ParE family toxin [Herminiimonas sp.]
MIFTIPAESRSLERFATDLRAKAEKLRAHPELFRIGRKRGTREMVVHPNYVVIYRAQTTSVEILRIKHTDAGNDDVLFFADDGGSSNLGVNWRSTLPTYFQCLAAIVSPADFAGIVVSTINEFVHYDRSHHLAAAHVVGK